MKRDPRGVMMVGYYTPFDLIPLQPLSQTPPLLAEAVDHFGREGGFDAILKRLKRKETTPIPLLKLYIVIFWQVCDLMFESNLASSERYYSWK